MKITVARKELVENLKFVNKACAVKSSMPILSGISCRKIFFGNYFKVDGQHRDHFNRRKSC